MCTRVVGGTGALSAALVDISRRRVEDAQHRDEAVGSAVRPRDVRAARADVGHVDADPSRRLKKYSLFALGAVTGLGTLWPSRQGTGALNTWARMKTKDNRQFALAR